ncbi:hypothetical protein GQR58_007262 [Nymphon striatum]|nr:hypothetical protein GQR58_007262 [Nymphon striatum]
MLWSFLSIYYIVQLVTGSNLRFADDVVLFSESPQELQLMVEELRTANNKVDLEINESKTKVMLNINVEIQPIMTGNVALDQKTPKHVALPIYITVNNLTKGELISLNVRTLFVKCMEGPKYLQLMNAWIRDQQGLSFKKIPRTACHTWGAANSLNKALLGFCYWTIRDMLNMKQSTLGHKDMQMTRIIKDEADVQALVTMLENNWINPFDENSQELVSISSGKLATPDITEDLLHAHESGKKAYDAFKTERLEQELPARKFHDPMKTLNLKTFSNLSVKKMKTTAHGKELVLKADRNLFAHMLLVTQNRKLKMEDVLSHLLGHELQNNVVPAANIPQPCCCIIDGMALVQKMRGEGIFSELASILLGSILMEGRTCSRIDVVFDVYRAGSIKDAERLRRGSSTGTSFKNIAPGHKLHQWRKFLANSNNKECLVMFLVKEWQEEKHRKKLNDKSLFVTRGKLCYHVTSSGTQIASDQESTQKEADTRMLLHAAHASRSDYEAIVVVSDDTDVLVLCLAFKPPIPTNMYVKCGTKTRVKYADITKVLNALGYELSQALTFPGPGGQGWKLDLSDPDGGLVLDWMEGKPAPEIVLELLVCTCSRLCEIETCMCMKNSLKCTDLCKLQTCTNQTIRTDNTARLNTAQEMDDSDSDEE